MTFRETPHARTAGSGAQLCVFVSAGSPRLITSCTASVELFCNTERTHFYSHIGASVLRLTSKSSRVLQGNRRPLPSRRRKHIRTRRW